ncbi:hypothetical protein Hanom_Chr09g00848291 [Helianthus anomalus]
MLKQVYFHEMINVTISVKKKKSRGKINIPNKDTNDGGLEGPFALISMPA